MSWISKPLTLDLLAIAIDGLNKAYERINAEPEAAPVSRSPWPDPVGSAMAQGVSEAMQDMVSPPAAPAPAETPPTAPVAAPVVVEQIHVEEAPQPKPTPVPEPTPDLLPEAQNILRTIAQTQGTDWITGTLFPHFGTNSLNTVPAERLPELIEMANAQAGTPA